MNCLPALGLPVNKNVKLGRGIKEIINYYNYIESIRNKLDYDIDGVVIIIHFLINVIGERSKSPDGLLWKIKITARNYDHH